MVKDLNITLGALMNNPQLSDSNKYITDSLATYKEMLHAAEQGLKSGRLLDSERASEHRDNLQVGQRQSAAKF